MRLLLVSANFRPAVGGIDRFTEVLATGLAGAGHDVTVLCCRKDGAPLHEAADGVRIERIRSSYALHRLLYLPYPAAGALVTSSARSGGSSRGPTSSTCRTPSTARRSRCSPRRSAGGRRAS